MGRYINIKLALEKIAGPKKTIVSLPVHPRRAKISVKMAIGRTKVLDLISSKTEFLMTWLVSCSQHFKFELDPRIVSTS